ncbi:MAG: GDSL-type esterase/lipase family protein [Pseudomonadota bacterium]
MIGATGIRRLALVALAAAALAGAFIAGRWSAAAPPAPLVCRPSAPEIAAAAASPDGPVALMIGNSQLHDRDWTFPRAFTVNCARQGLTARRAHPLIAGLPPIAPDVVFIAFGAVELSRAALRDAAPDAAAFAAEIAAVRDELRRRWPEAELVFAGVPPLRPRLFAPGSIGVAPEDVAPLNSGLAALAAETENAAFADTASWLSSDEGGLAREMTYDGLHLTQAAYEIWETGLGAASRVLSGAP